MNSEYLRKKNQFAFKNHFKYRKRDRKFVSVGVSDGRVMDCGPWGLRGSIPVYDGFFF